MSHLEQNKLTKVVLCHEADNDELAKRLSFLLQLNGIQSSALPTEIPADGDLPEDVSERVRNCKVLIVLLTEKTLQSASVLRVLSFAHQQGKEIRPLLLEKFRLSKDFTAVLPKKEQFDGSKNLDDTLRSLLSNVCTLLQIPGTVLMDTPAKKEPEVPSEPAESEKVEPAEENPEEKPAKKKWLLPVILSSVLVVVAGIVAVFLLTHPVICGTRYSVSDTILSLSGQDITAKDLSGIGKMKKLLTVAVDKCTVAESDISALASSPVLETLQIENCNLTDAQISSLSITGLSFRTLSLKNSKGFGTCPDLSSVTDTIDRLCLSHTEIKTLPDLSGAASLNTLELSGVSMKGQTLKIKGVKTLYLNNCNLTDLRLLSDSDSIRELYVSGNGLKTLKGLEKSIWLSVLDASDNKLSDIGGLVNSTQLKTVNLNNNVLENDALEVLKKSYDYLSELHLDGNRLTDTEFVREMNVLSMLSINGNQIETLSVFKCPALRVLSASDNGISTLDWKDGGFSLSSLDLSGNKLSGIETLPMENRINVSLDLSHNALSSDVFLNSEIQYKSIRLYGNAFTSYNSLYLTKADELVVDFVPTLKPEDLQTSNYNITIVNCPLDQQAMVKTVLSFRVKFVDLKPGERLEAATENAES